MKDDLGSVWGPTQRTPKNFRKEKSKVKNRQSLAKAIHIHGASHAGRQPKAKTRQMGSNRDIAFPNRKVRKIKFGIGNHKSIGQAQAQKHASRQWKNQAEKSKPSSRWASQLARQAAKKPNNQADRYQQAARPARKTRGKKRASNTTSQRSSQHASQATRPPASKPTKQPPSKPDKSK